MRQTLKEGSPFIMTFGAFRALPLSGGFMGNNTHADCILVPDIKHMHIHVCERVVSLPLFSHMCTLNDP